MSSSQPIFLEDLIQRIAAALASNSLISLTLTDSVDRTEATPSRITIRPVTVRQRLLFQAASRIGKQEHHQNFEPDALLQQLLGWFGISFRNLMVRTQHEDLQARWKSEGRIQATIKPVNRPPVSSTHDRQKRYLIPEGKPCAFLVALGVMTAEGKVLTSKQDKFRQINRFLEIVNDVCPSLPTAGPLNVVDFGCGLSYLTFAVHHLLTAIHHRDVRIIGIDRKVDVIERCRQTAVGLYIPEESLSFLSTDIDAFHADNSTPMHLAISLHACDTATDAALTYAVKHQAQVILAAPCCQHELAAQINAPELELINSHGILKERLAALATDALRGAALEAAGYRTQIIEFIDTEHTPKNLLIRAVRRPDTPQATNHRVAVHQRYVELKRRLGINTLATDRILDTQEFNGD